MKGKKELTQKQKTHSLKKEKTLKVDSSKHLNKIFQLLGNYQENTEYKCERRKPLKQILLVWDYITLYNLMQVKLKIWMN